MTFREPDPQRTTELEAARVAALAATRAAARERTRLDRRDGWRWVKQYTLGLFILLALPTAAAFVFGLIDGGVGKAFTSALVFAVLGCVFFVAPIVFILALIMLLSRARPGTRRP